MNSIYGKPYGVSHDEKRTHYIKKENFALLNQ